MYRQYKDKVYFWLLGKMKSEYWAQELLQQTFVKVWVSRGTLSADVATDVQLFRIARSLMIDQLRKLANERKLAGQVMGAVAEESTEVHYQVKEMRQEIDKIIHALPEVGKQVFRLSREYGLTYNEIAEELSISPKTVEYHISRTLRMLRKSLAPLFVVFFH